MALIVANARVDEDDYLWLNGFDVDGARNMSEKIRWILKDARRRHQQPDDYEQAFKQAASLIEPTVRRVRALENAERIHSDLVIRVLEWLPDVLAQVNSAIADNADAKALAEMEADLADRVFRLFEAIMQMGVTSRCPCYDSGAVANRLEPILDYAQIILNARNNKKES